LLTVQRGVFVKKIFNFLRPAKNISIIEDEQVVDKKYKHWRFQMFFSIYFGYAFFYLTRKSFTFAMPTMSQDLGLSKVELGVLVTVMSIAYGFSKFVNGILGDKSNARFFMGIGLILSGVCNICFGLSSSMLMFVLFWGLNGWIQGMGWPPCARTLTHWFSKSERGMWWGFWATAHNVGGAAVAVLVGYIAHNFGWRYAMYVPGVLCIGMGFVLIYIMRDTPQSIGLPAIENYKKEKGTDAEVSNEEKELSVKEILFKYVLSNPYIWILGVSYFFVYIIRTAINDWTAVYLFEDKNYSQIAASSIVSWFEIGGFFGILFAGYCSDFFFKGNRGPMNIIFAAALFVPIFVMYSTLPNSVILDSICLFGIGFFVFGPQMLIGLYAAELAHKKAAATATGFVGCFAYLGAAVAGMPIGKLIQDYGWWAFFVVMSMSGIIATLCLLPTWSIKDKKSSTEKLEAG
jgi:MFS transporter, OPA family, sugar phosphate sensor protein UhpC